MVALRQNIKPIPFHKSSKEGVSHFLRDALPLLLSNDDKVIRLVLTITRMCESLRTNLEFDETPITSPYSGDIDLDEFTGELEQFLLAAPWFDRLRNTFQANFKPVTKLRGRIKAGPNGSAIASSHYDAIALKRSPEMLENIKELNTLCNQTLINKSLNFCISESQDLALGRVSLGRYRFSIKLEAVPEP